MNQHAVYAEQMANHGMLFCILFGIVVIVLFIAFVPKREEFGSWIGFSAVSAVVLVFVYACTAPDPPGFCDNASRYQMGLPKCR